MVSRNRMEFVLRDFFRISFLKTFYYNFVSRHVVRKNRGFVVVYNNTVITFENKAALVVDGGTCYIGFAYPEFSKCSTVIRIATNGKMHMESGSIIEYGNDIYVKKNSTFIMKHNSYLNCNCMIRVHYYVSFGVGSITATEVHIRDIVGGGHPLNGDNSTRETIIGDHVWLGARATVVASNIGDGSVIGACSLVTKEIPPGCLAYGVPAVVHKENITWEY